MSDVPVDPTLAQERALARRRKRKAEKRKNAVARDSFLTSISGSPDKQALAASMKALMEREGIGPFGEPPAERLPVLRLAWGPPPWRFPPTIPIGGCRSGPRWFVRGRLRVGRECLAGFVIWP